MRSKTSESIARSKEPLQRPRLFSRWVLPGVALMVLVPLALIYPKQTLIQEAARQRLGNPLTANYLTNLLKTDPDNLELRLLLAEQKLQLGESGEISRLLAPVVARGTAGQRHTARLLEFKALATQIAGLSAVSPQRADMMRRQRDVLADLAGAVWPGDILVELANAAIAAGAPDTAHQLYRQLAGQDGPQSAQWFAQAARGALGHGYYELAAELYFIARHKAASPEEQRDHLIAGLKALLAESRFTQAMQAADRELGALADDPETLYTLAGMARSANDLPRAGDYARRLLQPSFFERARRWLAAEPQPFTPPRGMRPYDARYYQLAWEIYLASRNLEDAFKVAEAAVRQVPDDLVWRERLAQVAEWSGKPEIALQQWLQLARHGSAEAWRAVLRLAPGLNDYPATLEAWRYVAARRSLAPAEWQRIADLYELAAQPIEGANFLIGRYPHERDPHLLELAARLQHNGGQDDDALKTWLRLIESHGATTDRVLKAATLYLQRGSFREAAELLKRHHALAGATQAGAPNTEYWRLLGDLASRLQKDAEARDAYRRLATGPDATHEDLWRLASLLRREHPEEAAALAELAWRKFGETEMLLWALELHAEQRNLAAGRRLFDSIGADRLQPLVTNPRFLLLRAQYRQAAGLPREAMADYRRAAALAPGNAGIQTALLWYLIDRREAPALRESLVRLLPTARDNPAYWGAFAAAYHVLDQPDEAVVFYSRRLKHSGQDYLWLLNYADALERSGQAGMAWRVRQHAWRELRKGKTALGKPDSPQMLAAARLALQTAPGDPALALVREIVRQDRQAGKSGADVKDNFSTPAVSELILGWAVSNEQHSAAKAWLWQRYGRSLTRPLWGEVSVALAENDTEKLDRLIAEQADALPIYNRNDAARATGQARYAQSIAFDGLTASPNDDELHLRLSEDVLPAASNIGFEFKTERFGPVKLISRKISFDLALTTKLRLTGQLSGIRQASLDQGVLSNPLAAERVAGIGFKWANSLGETAGTIQRRREFDDFLGLRLSHAVALSQRLHLDLGAERHAAATESGALHVAGMKDQLDATLLYNFSKREYLRLQPRWARYYTQGGSYLGSGRMLDWETGYHIRTEYPDWTVRLAGAHYRFNRDGAADAASAVLAPDGLVPAVSFFLPDNTNSYQLCTGFGEAYRYTYTRAVRPYVDLCANHNDVSGGGYSGLIGIAGSVAGHDHATVYLSQSRAGAGFSGLSRELVFRYYHLLDRY